MTRKTQIGLLTTASVLCCAGVFIGARLSNGSHASMMDGQKPSVADAPPPAPTPVAETPKNEPTISKINEPLSPPPDLKPLSSVDQASAQPAPDDLPPLPPPGSKAASTDLPLVPPVDPPVTRPAPSSEITLVRADQPAVDNKPAIQGANLPPMPNVEPPVPMPSDLPPPPPPTVKDKPASEDLTDPLPPRDRFKEAPAKSVPAAPKELTEKLPTPVAPAPPPPIAPRSADSLPPPASPVYGPGSQDAGSLIKTEGKPLDVGPPPRLAKPDEPPQPPTESGPPARIVPVSPTTPVTTPSAVTPVLKKQPAAVKAKTWPLTGTHACKLDEKSGLILPRAVREQMGEQDTLFATLGSDHCVWLTTAAGLEKLTDRMEKSPAVEDDAKVARRRYFAQTERIAVDKNGCMVVPAALLESAGLKQDAVLIGVGDHLELWDVQRWHKYSQTPGVEPDAGAVDRHDEL